MLTLDDYVVYLDEALDGMVEIVTQLGDDRCNEKPDYPGSNSPFAILTHCLGVMEFWAGHAIAGREYTRDRPSEFVATGRLSDLLERVVESRRKLADDLSDIRFEEPPRGALSEEDRRHPLGRTQGGTLMHIYEELAQHRGQMEICRDVLLTNWVKLA
jgi:hypothetical protein